MRAPDVGSHVMVKLCDVYPAGEVRRIVDRAARLHGGVQAITVDLGHTGYRLRPGHRLRLEVSSSAFPRYLWHPGATDDQWDATMTQVSGSALLTGPSGSSLVLTGWRLVAMTPRKPTAPVTRVMR